jgi:hypothetical protein
MNSAALIAAQATIIQSARFISNAITTGAPQPFVDGTLVGIKRCNGRDGSIAK